LLSAPAGFGKTALLSDWIATHPDQPRFAWLSLDERDNDRDRFFSYFIAALQTVEAALGQGAASVLQTPLNSDATYPFEAILTSLLNDLAADSAAWEPLPTPFARTRHPGRLSLLGHIVVGDLPMSLKFDRQFCAVNCVRACTSSVVNNSRCWSIRPGKVASR